MKEKAEEQFRESDQLPLGLNENFVFWEKRVRFPVMKYNQYFNFVRIIEGKKEKIPF